MDAGENHITVICSRMHIAAATHFLLWKPQFAIREKNIDAKFVAFFTRINSRLKDISTGASNRDRELYLFTY